MAQLIAAIGKRNTIVRENHGSWGYHYHYRNAEGDRSDTIFTFERTENKRGEKIVDYEAHAEGKSSFHARVDLWGEKKRQSAYKACLKGLGKFRLKDFKSPGSGAAILWPTH